jgi:hypothetical protein
MTITHSQIVKAIFDLIPEAQFVLSDTDYENIQWLDERTKPTFTQIKKAVENPLPEIEPTIEQKLAFVGLSVDDLKAALGL